MYKLLNIILIIATLSSCNYNPTQISNTRDYEQYLNEVNTDQKEDLKEDLRFWEQKLKKAPSQFPYLSKIASVQSALFEATGQIDYLIDAENNLVLLNEITRHKKSGYLRSLARNYISQHKFNTAVNLLTQAEEIGENLRATQKMLFDIYLELGNNEKAKDYLTRISGKREFDYLIRLAKWKDHNGDLDAAIMDMEKSMQKAEASNNKHLMQWSYTNLADFYGHAGRIREAYDLYLKALTLNPNDAYAKKSIAWIVYSHEHNPEEALRILNATTEYYSVPDYHLVKANIAEYMDDQEQKDENVAAYLSAIANEKYENMYNKYSVLLFAEEKNNAAALRIAEIEIKNRPTAASYDLLAWAYYSSGDLSKALDIMENHVVKQTYEPYILYHLAQIYAASGRVKDARRIKEELSESTFELGPLTTQKLRQI